MAGRHDNDSGQNGDLTRRSYLRLAGATAAAAAFTGASSMTAVAASPDDVVDLGEEGLSDGDLIDDYLKEYVDDGVEVRVPEGEYEWDGEGFTGATRDAAIVGQGEVVLNLRSYFYGEILAESGTVEVRNFTVRGTASGHKTHFRLTADDDATVLIDNFNFPDGIEEGERGRPFYVPSSHAGVVNIRNCYYKGWDNNGIYASSPGKGEGGPVIVENCVAHNNNISGIRIGSSESVVRNCLVINDGPAPRNDSGQRNQRGIRVREPGEDILIEDCEIIHSYEDATAPIELHDGAEGGTGEIKNVRIRNDGDTEAINGKGDGAEGWTASNVSITGDGDLEYPSHFDGVETGDDASAPSGDDPQEEPSLDDGSADTSDDEESGDSGGSDHDETDEWDDPDDVDADVFEVVSLTDGEDVSYRFEVDGDAEMLELSSEIRAGHGDSIDDGGETTVVEGFTGNEGYGDVYAVDGDIVDFERLDGDAEIELRLNDEVVDADELTGDGAGDSDEQGSDDDSDDSGDEELSNVLIVDGTVSDDVCTYEVVVSGEIERSDGLSSVTADGDDEGSAWDDIEDHVGGKAVRGLVAKGIDGYRFSGRIVNLSFDGRADVTLEQTDR